MVWPTGVLNAACSNSGTVRPRVIGGSNPPFFALPGSSEYCLARAAKFTAVLQLLLDVVGLGLGSIDGFLVDFAIGSGVPAS